MTSAQKIIKYFAFGFACLLAFSIIAGIVAAGTGILTGVGIINRGAPEASVDCAQHEKCLSLQISYSELYVKKGDKIAVESSDNEYEVISGDENLIVKDTKKTSWFGNSSRRVIVTLPEDLEFDVAGISSGAGRIEIEKISAKELNLSLGAGEAIIKDIEVSDKANISAGAGKFVVEGGKIHDAKVSLGLGDANIKAAITGKNNKIDAGIGSVNLSLLMPASKYAIKVDKGIGEILFNDSSVSSGMVVQGGENEIDVDGGIGKIKINTIKEE